MATLEDAQKIAEETELRFDTAHDKDDWYSRVLEARAGFRKILALTPSPCSCSARAAEALDRRSRGPIDEPGRKVHEQIADLVFALKDIRDNPCQSALTVEAVVKALREAISHIPIPGAMKDEFVRDFRARLAKEAPDA